MAIFISEKDMPPLIFGQSNGMDETYKLHLTFEGEATREIKSLEQHDKEIEARVAKEIYTLCERHGTTWIKKHIKERYGINGEIK